MTHKKFALMFVILFIAAGVISWLTDWPLLNCVFAAGIVTTIAGAWMASQWRPSQ